MSEPVYSIVVKGREALDQAHALAVACYGVKAEPPEWWVWRYFGEGCGISELVLAEQAGGVVGMQPITIQRVQSGRETSLGAVLTGGMVHPNHRGRGLFTRLIQASEREALRLGASVAMTMPNAKSHAAFRKLGWIGQGERQLHARCTFLGRGRALQTGSFEVTRVAGLEEVVAGLNEEGGACEGCIGFVRDTDWLGWRYRDNALGSYQRWQATDTNGHVTGVLALSVRRVRGVAVGFLLDLLAGSATVRGALMASALSYLRASRVGLVLSVMSAQAARHCLTGLGFTRLAPWLAGKRFYTMTRPLGSDGAALQSGAPGGWHLTLGDWDGV